MRYCLEILAFASMAWLGYVYVGYPICLSVFGIFLRFKSRRESSYLPKVSVLISARNEEKDIAWKINETLGWDYPEDRLEVLVASDASDDGTDGVLRKVSDPRFRFIRLQTRSGKNAALNELAKIATGELFFFTDANTHVPSHCLRTMVEHFADDRVGCVTGTEKTIRAEEESATAEGGGAYLGYESIVNMLESRLGSVSVCDGSIYCIRGSLFSALDPDLANDLEHPINIGAQKKKIIFEPAARSLEKTTSSVKQEFSRRVRITGQGALGMWRLRSRLHGLRRWQFLSRKLMRWLSIIPMSSLLVCSVVLASGSELWWWFALAQIFFYSVALVGWRVAQSNRKLPFLFSIAFYFLFVHAAAFRGVLETCRGRRFRSWEIAGLSRGTQERAVEVVAHER